ncbi:hypothetical protein CDD81_4883 [Ophiocordyceps australis]|uniref:Uncharacterized protein n=1 Tax=Ophiocordyceps australis TaxID=1399860 RepID=A0A2C5XN68_9HYPO|nr:hypothetical protein CDD81_4883 [Ophiocordyceps australis]
MLAPEPTHRKTTEDVDFIINIDEAPDGVKRRLLALSDSPFIQRAQMFYYKCPAGGWIQVDFTAQMTIYCADDG